MTREITVGWYCVSASPGVLRRSPSWPYCVLSGEVRPVKPEAETPASQRRGEQSTMEAYWATMYSVVRNLMSAGDQGVRRSSRDAKNGSPADSTPQRPSLRTLLPPPAARKWPPRCAREAGPTLSGCSCPSTWVFLQSSRCILRRSVRRMDVGWSDGTSTGHQKDTEYGRGESASFLRLRCALPGMRCDAMRCCPSRPLPAPDSGRAHLMTLFPSPPAAAKT